MQSFEKIINELANGAFISDCDTRLSEVLKAVEEVGGTGSVTLNLKITRLEDGTATIAAEVSGKKPFRKRHPSLFFLNNGQLHKEDPRQLTLKGENVLSLDPTKRIVAKEF